MAGRPYFEAHDVGAPKHTKRVGRDAAPAAQVCDRHTRLQLQHLQHVPVERGWRTPATGSGVRRDSRSSSSRENTQRKGGCSEREQTLREVGLGVAVAGYHALRLRVVAAHEVIRVSQCALCIRRHQVWSFLVGRRLLCAGSWMHSQGRRSGESGVVDGDEPRGEA